MTLPDDYIQQIRAIYPKRSGGQGWGALPRLINRMLSNGVTWDEILDGTKRYKRWCDATGKTGSELVKMARTFYGPDMWCLEDYEVPGDNYVPRKPEVVTDEMRKEDERRWREDMERLGQLKLVR